MSLARRKLARSEERGADHSEPLVAAVSLRVPLLLVILLAALVAFLRVLPQDRVLQAALTRPFQPNPKAAREAQLATLRRNDPRLGSMMPIPGADSGTSTGQTSRSESQRSAGYILVAMIGPCSECVKGTLEVAEQYALQHPTVRVVAASPSAAKDLRTFRELNRLHLQLVSDPYRKLEHIYNAAWMPRAYLLSAGGSLLWCQTESDFALPPDELVRPRHERE